MIIVFQSPIYYYFFYELNKSIINNLWLIISRILKI